MLLYRIINTARPLLLMLLLAILIEITQSILRMSEQIMVLKPSLIEGAGVGCFALSAIGLGERITVGHRENNRRLPEQEIHDSYLKYCPLLDSGLYLAPANFAVMSVLWYINHAREPNLQTEGWRLYATRDIDEGEELTMYYPDLFTHPKNKEWVIPEVHA